MIENAHRESFPQTPSGRRPTPIRAGRPAGRGRVRTRPPLGGISLFVPRAAPESNRQQFADQRGFSPTPARSGSDRSRCREPQRPDSGSPPVVDTRRFPIGVSQPDRRRLACPTPGPLDSRSYARTQIRCGRNRAEHYWVQAFHAGRLAVASRSFPVDRDTRPAITASYPAGRRGSSILTQGAFMMLAAKEAW